MSQYMDQIKRYIAKYVTSRRCDPMDSVLELLFYCYTEFYPVNTEQIRTCFRELNERIPDLKLEEKDMVFDTVSDLCDAYERAAFFMGIRVGAELAAELSAN